MPYAFILSAISYELAPQAPPQIDLKFYLKGPIHVMNTIDLDPATHCRMAIR